MILLITYLLNLFDLTMTTLWVKLYGISAEGNPIGRWLFENNMAWAVKIFAVGGLLALMGVCIHRRPRLAPVAYIPLVVYGLIAVYHAIILVYPYIF